MTGGAVDGPGGPVVALVVSRFPKFTETFVVDEALALERLGLRLEIHPLLPVEPGPHQPAAVPLVERAVFGKPWGREELAATARMLRRRPARVAGVVGQLVRDTWRRPSFMARDLVLLPRVCAIAHRVERDSIDHVHAHFATHAGFAAWAIGRLTGVPYSIVAHGSDVHRHQLMLPVKVRESAFVATVSDHNRSVILEVCGPEASDRVEVVRIGVDLDGIAPRAPGPVGDPPVVLCVGTLHEVKGQRHLLAAVARLRARGRDVRVRLVGGGPDGPALTDLARELGLAGSVELTGPLPRDRVLDAYADADVVVVPSVPSSDGRKEGLPTVLAEAMASGVPVVASRLTGIPELVEDGVTGLLAEPGDADALADQIERLVTDDALRARLRATALERVRSAHAIDTNAARMAALIRRSATRPPPGRGSSR